jgi:hypothetical protein
VNNGCPHDRRILANHTVVIHSLCDRDLFACGRIPGVSRGCRLRSPHEPLGLIGPPTPTYGVVTPTLPLPTDIRADAAARRRPSRPCSRHPLEASARKCKKNQPHHGVSRHLQRRAARFFLHSGTAAGGRRSRPPRHARMSRRRGSRRCRIPATEAPSSGVSMDDEATARRSPRLAAHPGACRRQPPAGGRRRVGVACRRSGKGAR